MNAKLCVSASMAIVCFMLRAAAATPDGAPSHFLAGRMDRIPSVKSLHGRLIVAANLPSLAAVAAAGRVDRHISDWVSFDAPAAGPLGTFPAAINDLGEITGNYNDATPAQAQHGFVRTANGTVISFDPAGSQLTSPDAINDEGVIVGYYTGPDGNNHGFIRTRTGVITTFDAVVDSPYTQPNAINDLGQVAGTYVDENGGNHGFLRDSNGVLTTIDAPGATAENPLATQCGSINVEGEVGCQYLDAAGTWHALLRYPGGTLMIVNAPGAGTGTGDLGTFTGFLQAVNALGQMTGEYADPNNGYHGYVRDAAGRFVEFTVQDGGTNNANGTYPAALNLWGLVSGFSYDANGFPSGFLRFPNNTLDAFQAPAPNNQGTFLFGNNDWGQFTGFSYDSNGTAHGFVAVATP
jgi:hypothetical protein